MATLRFAFIGLLFLLLTACATNQQMVGGRVSLPEKIAPEDGVLLVKLVGIQRLSVFNAKWKSIKVTGKKDGIVTEIFDTAPIFASYSLFMGTLPPDQYEITSFESLGMGPGSFGLIPALVIMAMTTDAQALNSRFSTFTVRPGKVSNLGTIVSSFSEIKDEPMRIAVLANAFGQASALQDVEPAAKARLAKMPVLSWDKAAESATDAKALESIRKFATNVASLDSTTDQQILIGSALGMLHVRKPDGSWSSMATGGLDSLTYVRPLDSGRIFAASDSGKYYLWLPEKGLWLENKLLDVDYRILGIEPMGQHGYALLATTVGMPTFSNPMKTKVFFKKNLEEAGNAIEAWESEGFSATGRLPMFFDGENLQVFFNHVGFSRKLDLYKINPLSLQKKQETRDYWVSNFYRLPDGTLVMDRMNGLSHYNSFSADQGRTWRHNENGGPHSVRFVDANLGYGFSTLSTGWSSVTSTLNKSTDGGKTWTQTGKPLETSGLLQVQVVNGVLYVYTGKQLLSTADDGATWKSEWPLTR